MRFVHSFLWLLFLAAATASTTISVCAEEVTEVLIITNADNTAESKDFQTADYRAMFLKEKKTWSDGTEIVAVQLESTTKEAEVFRLKVLDKTEDELTKYWTDLREDEGVEPPVSKKDSKGVYRTVSGKKNAIGYVAKSYYDGLTAEEKAKVKILLTLSG